MDPGPHGVPLERVRRCPGDCLPPGRVLTGLPHDTPESVRAWAAYTEESPLYTELTEVVATSPELMRLLNRIEHAPRPNILFAAVQFLLEEVPGEPLRRFYPSFTAEPLPRQGVRQPFADFALDRQEEIAHIGRTRYTQTNECRRCVALLPGVMATGLDRFHLVDLGASAGLNLALDKYAYRWSGLAWGPEATMTLETELRGAPPRLRDIEVLSRTALDLNPIDPADEEDRRWLSALVWPEQHERRVRLERALELVSPLGIEFVEGDAIETLAMTLAALPAGEPAIVLNSMVLNQFSDSQRDDVEACVADARRDRDVHRVSFETIRSKDRWTLLEVESGAGWEKLGKAHHHGEWVELEERTPRSDRRPALRRR